MFYGENPDGWLLKAEKFFKFYQLTDEERIEVAVMSMDGAALLWY